MELGVLVRLDDMTIGEKIKKVKEMGFNSCQITAWKMELLTDEVADIINSACKKHGVTVSTFWCGYSGPAVWNFYEGPITLGLIPVEYRAQRVNDLILGSDFAKKLGVTNVATHVGFLPETPYSGEYQPVVCAIRTVAKHCLENGQLFLFETGQETPVTLRRTIEDVGTGNLGINLDPANLILYGKANPIDALDVFGDLVREIHAKDGLYPTDGKHLGKEVPIGKGKVNFPEFIKKLKEIGYDGKLTIEREIFGEQQLKDIIEAKAYLESII